MTSRWDPAQHPRGPLGRFSVVGAMPSAVRRRAELRTAYVGDRNRDDDTIRPSYLDEDDLSVLSQDPAWGNMEPARRSEVARAEAEYQRLRAAREADEAIRNAPLPRVASPRPEDWDEPGVAGRPESRAEIEQSIDRLSDYDDTGVMPGNVEALGAGSFAQSVHSFEIRDTSKGYGRAAVLPYKAVRKQIETREEASAEILSSEVAAATGANVAITRPDSIDGRVVWMERAEGSLGVAAEEPNQRDYTREEVRNYRESAARLAKFDQLVGNRDRHGANWVLSDDGTVIGIDNGLAFGATEDNYRSPAQIRKIQTEFMPARYEGVSGAVGRWATWEDRIPDEEIQAWGPKLEALGPIFAAHGRTDWHTNLMDNYRAIQSARDSANWDLDSMAARLQ